VITLRQIINNTDNYKQSCYNKRTNEKRLNVTSCCQANSNLQQLLSTLRFWETRSRDTGEAINTNTAAAAAASDDDNDNDDDV